MEGVDWFAVFVGAARLFRLVLVVNHPKLPQNNKSLRQSSKQ